MAHPPESSRPPGSGWTLGAEGFPKPFWIFMTLVLGALGVTLLTLGYAGYGALLLVIAIAAAVNVL